MVKEEIGTRFRADRATARVEIYSFIETFHNRRRLRRYPSGATSLLRRYGSDTSKVIPSQRKDRVSKTSGNFTHRAATIGRMLSRLGNAIAAELTSIESMEQRADRRRVRTVVAVIFVTTDAEPAWEGTHRLLAHKASTIVLDPTTSPSPHQHLPRSRRPDSRTRP